MKTVAIIQARLTSRRFPRKVLEKVGGKSMIARVCEAARGAALVDKVIVAWAHHFPHLDENDVLGRFQEVVKREGPAVSAVIRLTSDCPLLTPAHIDNAIKIFEAEGLSYFSAGPDGFDVQVFRPGVLFDSTRTDREHVIWTYHKMTKWLSVDTPADLERVRAYA